MSVEAKPKALLAGIGSPYGGDQIGWHAVDCLKQVAWAQCHPAWQWQITTLDRPGSTLLDALQGVALAILLDALQAEGGGPRRLMPDELLSELAPISGHALGLAETLQLGHQLDMLPEQLLIVGLPMGMSLDPRALSDWLDHQLAEFFD